MIFPSMIPRDANGLVCGVWRLVHESPTFTGELGVVPFRNGTSVNPVAGHILSRLSAVCGHVLYLEPWGELPRGFRMPEGHTAKVPESALAKLKRAPWRDAPKAEPALPPVLEEPKVEADALDDMSIDDLRALAELHSVELDGRWKEAKIRIALREAGVTA